MAKAESKTILKAYSTVESKLPTLPLEDGQLIFVYDKKKIILDNHGVRTVYEQIQTIETEEQRNDLLAPIDSFYFVIETSILWRYSNGHWNQITTSPQEQIDRISAEGTKQVKVVQDKGAEVLQSIPENFPTQMESKLDKQQGVENKGKALVIGEDGLVVPGEVQSGGDGIAIVNTASGESPLVIPDSAERVNKGFGLTGKTEQVQTTGAQLFDKENLVVGVLKYDGSIVYSNGYYTSDYIAVEPNTKYICTRTGSKRLKFYSADKQPIQTVSFSDANVEQGGSFTTRETTKYVRFSVVGDYINTVMFTSGVSFLPYEPYTGGKPSPSPEYPQEIKNSGKWNEEKQKYEVDVKVVGKNLFDREKAKDNSNWIIKSNDGYAKFPIYVKKGNKITFSYTEKLTTGKKFYLGISLSDAGSTVAWLYHDTTASIINNKYTIAATNDYIYLMCSKSDIQNFVDTIQTLQVEISPTQTDYQPYAEQFLTLTSDRPLTKWDKLVEQGGQIGWLYKSKLNEIPKTGYEIRNTDGNKYGVYFGKKGIFKDAITTLGSAEKDSNLFTHFKPGNPYSSNGNIAWLYVAGGNTDLRLKVDDETINTVELFEKYIADKDIKIIYETTSTEFVPLPQSEQNAIRALKTYYPTTVITADGGELYPDIKVTYTADTKNYIDNKFAQLQKSLVNTNTQLL